MQRNYMQFAKSWTSTNYDPEYCEKIQSVKR